MKAIKDILNFCNAAIFYDNENDGIIEELGRVRKCVIDSFFKTIPNTALLTSLDLIDDIILKVNDKEIEKIIDNIHDLRENILYMLSFEKLFKDNNGELIIRDDNDNEQCPIHFSI